MRTSPNDGNVLFNRDEEFRQTVIRQAIMLGMQAEEYEYIDYARGKFVVRKSKRWRFKDDDGEFYGAYISLYSAAFDYLRIIEVPTEVIGVIRHAKIQDT